MLSNIPLREVFVGRVEELEQLAEAMRAKAVVVTQVVAGLGGIGKSTLVAEHAHRHAGEYTGVWWLTADTRANAEGGLAALTRRVTGIADVRYSDDVLADWAISWIQCTAGMLLVWDNVDDLEEVRPLLAALSGDVHHLVTSRREGGWHRIGVERPLRLGAMRPDDAVQLLTRLAGPGLDTRTAEELCAELGCLPLAVEQVGAYLSEAGVGAQEYLDRWRTVQARVVALAPEKRPGDRIMTGVWRITLDKLGDTPLAGDLLRVMAWFAPDGIPRSLLAPVADNADEVGEALRRLNAYSMVHLDPSGGAVSVHRVVQAVTRAPDPADPHRQPDAVTAAQNTAIGILDSLIPADDHPASDAADRWRVLLPHIDAFAAFAAGRSVTTETATVMVRAFDFLHDQRNLAAGVHIAACALAGAQEHYGQRHPNTLITRGKLALAYSSAGKLDQAIPLFEQTAADSVRVLGKDHPDTLTTRHNLADAYLQAGDLGRAIALYEQNLADSVRILGADHPNTLGSHGNLASAYSLIGDLSRAIRLYGQALADSVRVLGEDHPDTLTSRNNLAYAYNLAGDPGRAIPLFEQNLADRLRVLGESHPDTLASRNSLAGAYSSVGDLDRAIPLLEQVLADRLKVLGKDHPDTLTSRNNLAQTYSSVGDLDRAIPLLEQALADRLRVLGKDHPNTLTSRNNLAYGYASAGSLDRAIPLYEQTLADRLRVLGQDHPDTLVSRNNLASANFMAGDLDQAIPLYEQALNDSVRVLDPDHPNTVVSRINLAYGYASAGSLDRAIPLYERALADSTRILGQDHPTTMVVQKSLNSAIAERDRGEVERS